MRSSSRHFFSTTKSIDVDDDDVLIQGLNEHATFIILLIL